MGIADYCRFVADKIDQATLKNDKDEVIRLMELLKATLEDSIRENK